MLACDLARVPLFAAIPVLHAAGLLPFWALLLIVATTGVFLAPYFSVQRAVVPELIGEEHADVAQASALFQAANRLTFFIGPPLAGILIGLIGTANVLYVDAATYLVSFALVALFVDPPQVPAPAERGVLAGARFVMRDRLLRVWTPAFAKWAAICAPMVPAPSTAAERIIDNAFAYRSAVLAPLTKRSTTASASDSRR